MCSRIKGQIKLLFTTFLKGMAMPFAPIARNLAVFGFACLVAASFGRMAAQSNPDPEAKAPAASAWPPAKLPDGQPDVQGFYGPTGNSRDPKNPGTFASYTIEGGLTTFAGGSDTTLELDIPKAVYQSVVVDPPGRVPYTQEAFERREYFRGEGEGLYDPLSRCVGGVPRLAYWGGFQIVQTKGTVMIVHEWNHFYRIIPVDGRGHAGKGLKLIMGDSVGHWEGNTLVIDVTNNSDLPWFDTMGDFHSDAMHLVERFNFVDPNTIKYEATVEDSKVLTQPMKLAMLLMRSKNKGKDYETWEFACHENEHEVEHILRAAGKLPPTAKTSLP